MEFKKPKTVFIFILSRDFVNAPGVFTVFFLVISKNNDWVIPIGIKIILISHSQFFFLFSFFNPN